MKNCTKSILVPINLLFFIVMFSCIEPGENETVDGLNDYPKEIAGIIYSKSKDFPNKTQISIAVTQDGKTNYYGIIKENGIIRSIENQDKIFEIGSLTKVLTSTVLALLEEEKKIKLTDYINTYYPFTFNDGPKITFESLANHTSGLPRLPENLDLSYEANPYKNYGKIELEEFLENLLKLQSEPLKSYTYSNLGPGLLGYTLGLSQKISFSELLQKKIFDKYGMTSSFTSPQNLENHLVKGLNTKGETVPNWDFDVLLGGGGILSTTEDLTKFAKAQFNPQNLALTLTRSPTFEINDKMKIGLGWHILKSGKGQELIWHNGGTGGYTSSMAVDIEGDISIIILSNVSAFNPKMGNIDDLCFGLIALLEK